MGNRDMRIVFSSGISDLTERNTSFDSGVLRVAYVGKNRNNSFISKETFERCMPSIYNCPIVCRYDRDANEIGSHDMELVVSDDGSMRIVNVTQPVGLVPAGARYWWEEIEDDSGIHEYLCVEVLLWKRQEAYRKIKEDGITDESMEITVKEGSMVDGVYHIEDFEFTAFCLLGTAEPCYESASLEVFSRSDLKQQLADMMQEFKETFAKVQHSQEVSIDPQKESLADRALPAFGGESTAKNVLPYSAAGSCQSFQNDSEGGEEVLDEKNKLMAEFRLTADMLDFSIEDFSLEELRAKFEALRSGTESMATEGGQENFELEGQFMQELFTALEAETVTTDLGSMPRYWFVDYDRDASEVYAEDYGNGWDLYGFPYSMNGNHVVIDFKCGKRKKYSIVDLDEGEQTAPANRLFELVSKRFGEVNTEWEEKFQKVNEESTAKNEELAALRKFKADIEIAGEQEKREAMFAQFEDLAGVEAFENLRERSLEFDLETLEEKCFAIRGRNGTVAKFSHESKTPKLPVAKHDTEPEPYGGLFAKYGVSAPVQHG